MARKSSISGDVDPLQINQLRGPLLDSIMKSPYMRNQLMNVAREIRSRYIAKVPKDTGRLSQSVRIKAVQSDKRDKRWMVDVTIGGVLGVDYADKIEAEYGTLAAVLREMGYKTGDFVIGPRGRGAKSAPAKKKPKSDPMAASTVGEGYEKLAAYLERFQRPGRRVGSQAYDADYETLQKMTQEVEDRYGRDQATIGRMALSSYEMMREAKGLSARPFMADNNNFRLVWFEAKGDKPVRKSKFFSTPEQAERWAESNLSNSGKVWPNSPRFDRYRDDDRYSSGMYKDNGRNLYGVIMNNTNRDG